MIQIGGTHLIRQKARYKMQIVINIPDEQIKKSLEESKYILEDEGKKVL